MRLLGQLSRLIVAICQRCRRSFRTFTGENPMSKSYVVGMKYTRGRLNIPGVYKAKNGKLIDLEHFEED